MMLPDQAPKVKRAKRVSAYGEQTCTDAVVEKPSRVSACAATQLEPAVQIGAAGSQGVAHAPCTHRPD